MILCSQFITLFIPKRNTFGCIQFLLTVWFIITLSLSSMVEEVHQSIKKENSTFALFDQELAVDSQSLQKSDIV